MASLISHRVWRTTAAAVTAVVVGLASGSCASSREGNSADYCAVMPDSVGLYVGNPVTQMGYQVGTVKAIAPGETNVRVDFTVTDGRRFPEDVKAITRSASVLADRSLELVGNLAGGTQLHPGECIPLSRSFTPKSLSVVIGSATNFINSVNPASSTNIADVVHLVDQAIQNKGAGINTLLTSTSSVLDSPDNVVNSIGSIIANLAQLTTLLKELRDPMKQILLDAQKTNPDVEKVTDGAFVVLGGVPPILKLVADIEMNLGQEVQFTLDSASMAIRKASAHAPAIADLLTPVPWWINTIANHYNNRPFNLLQYRPPMYRIRTPDGVAMCNIMNATAPGTCANVQGTPYAVDVALLQYALTAASNR